MLHHMKLNPDPFAKIANGTKTIELRLYDEKRAKIRAGDTLCFTNTADATATVFATVKKLHRFTTFKELYAALPLTACGYTEAEAHTASARDMELYYSAEAQARYGVVGIELEVLRPALTSPWLDWAVELQSIAQAGLFYGKDIFDLERYTRLREIAAEMLACKTDISPARVRGLFCEEQGYQTPKLDTRCAVVQDGKILLVQEKNGLWSLPGGWNEVTLSVAENAQKEAFEEAGARVLPRRIVAVQYRDHHPFLPGIHKICKVLVLCELLEHTFHANSETIDCGFFAPDALPPLDMDRTIPAQITLAFAAATAQNWETVFD